MMSRALVTRRPVSAVWCALGALLCLAASLSFGSAPASAAACANEARRWESNINPATGQAYSVGLPDCRAYEMVSPLDKQVHSAKPVPGPGLLAAPDPEAGGVAAAGFASEGAFANPENYNVNFFFPVNVYLSHRGASGWLTASAFAPANFLNTPALDGLGSDLSPDLRSVHASCGINEVGNAESATGGGGQGVVCAMRQGEAEWVHTQTYPTPANTSVQSVIHYMGGSSDLSRVFMQVGQSIQPEVDTLKSPSTAIYEFSGIGTPFETLRIVNVASNGTEMSNRESGERTGPLLGDRRPATEIAGSAYHAISEDGKTVFFTATPEAAQQPAGEQQTVYARINASSTVAVSNPSPPECTREGCPKTCTPVEAKEEEEGKQRGCHGLKPATFQGASADGTKVFFTTAQQLVKGDKNTSTDLYEYDFSKPAGENLTQISAGENEAEVAGAVRTSSDGGHVYFVATGVLTSVANKNGEAAQSGKANLYGYDTTTGELKFVAVVANKSEVAGGIEISTDGTENSAKLQRFAQTTPDGRYLAFSTSAQLAENKEENANCPEKGKCPKAAYVYNFQNGELTWASQAAPALKAERVRRGKSPNPNEGKSAFIAPLPGSQAGAEADINDWNRAISGESEVEAPGKTPQERHDGEFVIFTTTEKLQENDENKASDVYEWHAGNVALISDGHDAKGAQTGLEGEGEPVSTMSASGSDIYFLTHARLVGQDTDALADVYDARVGGGFPAPTEPSCSGSACQGAPSSLPSFGTAASSLYTGGQNALPPTISVEASMTSKPKPLTPAQQLATSLRACKHKAKSKRDACKSQAKKHYKAQLLAMALSACQKRPSAQRAACTSQARRRYR